MELVVYTFLTLVGVMQARAGPSGPAGKLIDEMTATGAVLVGRQTAEQVDHY